MSLPLLLRELEQIDRDLNGVSLGDFAALETILNKRSTLVHQLAAAIDQLAQPSPEHHAALLRSREAASQALRQLILARHMLVQELAQLMQDQRLSDALRGQSPLPVPGLSFEA